MTEGPGAGTPWFELGPLRVALPLALPRSRVVLVTLAAAWTLALAWLLTSTRVVSGPRFFGQTYLFNLAHGGVFALETLLLGGAASPGRPVGRPGRAWWLAAAAALAYSGLLELAQGTTDGRTASWGDMVTNAVGCLGVPWALAPRPGAGGRVALATAAGLGGAALATWVG